MKKLFKKIAPMCMSMATMMLSFVATTNCKYCLYQDKMPEAAKKLRKF